VPLTLWGNPILEQIATSLGDAEFGAGLAELGERMLRVMYAVQGVGLAVPQVGIGKRFFVYDCEGRRGLLANPVIIDRSRDLSVEQEACLSVPGFDWPTSRATGVVIEGRDAFGELVRFPAAGYLARCMQHETDHVDGQLYLSRLGGRLGKRARREAKQATWYGNHARFIAID
jgi:peptide deformylase